ncbi:hypothetical protein HanPI659440_Chr03g0128081 [Helianthus annuus]|nr:hypothetical protein HanPI659440_Chr03g0128081 [Helianthus annuus]
METKLTCPVQVGQKIQMLHKESQLTWTQEWKANGSRVNKEAMHNSDARCK